MCPACYDCSQINHNINKCYYRGKYYDIGEVIDESVPVPRYYAGCICTDQLVFQCAIVDCFFPPPPEGCYYAQSLDHPCPSETLCPNNITLCCNVNGLEVNQSQIFLNPKDACSDCVCERGVTGNPGDPNCRSNICDVEISQSNYILGYCAPVYNSLADCCPYNYICPRDDDNFLDCDSQCSITDSIGPRIKCVDQKECKSCRYGKSCYPIGTKFTRSENNTVEDYIQVTTCECVIPPYFTCIREF